MATNKQPAFPTAPKTSWCKVTAANTATDGTGTLATDIMLLATAGSEGRRIDSVLAVPLGTNVATVLRIFLNNGSANTTPANNTLVKEFALPSSLASSVVENGQSFEIHLGLSIDPGYRLLACVATVVAAGWQLTSKGGDF